MIFSISSIPFFPVSELFRISFSEFNFSSLLPSILKIGFNKAIEFSESPLPCNSSTTLSIPILSSLSIATVISIILFCSPITSAMPARIFLLFTLMITWTFNASNTSSMIDNKSTSFNNESLPMMSASHWKNSRYLPFCGRSARHTGWIW